MRGARLDILSRGPRVPGYATATRIFTTCVALRIRHATIRTLHY